MNPIEHLWEYLKHELHRRFPDTMHLSESPATVKKILKEQLIVIWREIGEKVLNQLLDSIEDKVKVLIKAEGWYTEY